MIIISAAIALAAFERALGPTPPVKGELFVRGGVEGGGDGDERAAIKAIQVVVAVPLDDHRLPARPGRCRAADGVALLRGRRARARRAAKTRVALMLVVGQGIPQI